MTTITTFVPSSIQPFQFQATLDGSQHVVIVTWNIFGQRYYINIYDLSNNLVLCEALVSSPLGFDLNLLDGIFASSTMVYREAAGQFEVRP